MTTYTADQITAIGGSRWTKAGRDRVYLEWDAICDMIGLEISRYNSGNISSARLDGEKISNRKANMIGGKVYLDVITGRIVIQGVIAEAPHAGRIHAAIAAAVAALTADDDQDDDTPTAEPAAIIATLRAAGRSARQIAEMVGVHVSTVYRWARGVFRPTAARYTALAALAA